MVEVPGWGVTIKLKAMSAYQQAVYDSFFKFDASGKVIPETTYHAAARAVCLSAVNDDDSPMFTIEDALSLADKGAAEVELVAKAVRTLNGWDKDDTVKNSPATTEG